MKQITLPVSGLTWAVMRHRYGPGVIRLHRNDLRRRELKHVGPTDLHLERKQYALTHAVTIEVSSQEYDHLAGRLPEVGFYLYAQDKNRMSAFVWSQVTAGLPALAALKSYYLLRGITDDEHDIETAERQWKRWRKEFQKERIYNTPDNVPHFICVLLSERQAEVLAARLVSLARVVCTRMDPRYLHAIPIWVFCDFTTMTQTKVATKFRMKQGNVSKSASRFRDYLSHHSELRTLASYCLKTTLAKPTPSAAS
jgi:hypothetical protein